MELARSIPFAAISRIKQEPPQPASLRTGHAVLSRVEGFARAVFAGFMLNLIDGPSRAPGYNLGQLPDCFPHSGFSSPETWSSQQGPNSSNKFSILVRGHQAFRKVPPSFQSPCNVLAMLRLWLVPSSARAEDSLCQGL